MSAPQMSGLPLALDAGDSNLYRYVANQPTIRTDQDGRYETDVHFYMTYKLAYALGLGGKDQLTGLKRDGKEYDKAYVIAWATEYTDWNPKTQPVTIDVGVRLTYHFRCSAVDVKGEKKQQVVAGSPEAYAIIKGAVEKEANEKAKEEEKQVDLMALGIGLHAFEDSWAHQGLVSSHDFSKVNPDEPTNKPPEVALAMAERVYNALDEWRKKHSPGSKPLKTFAELAGTQEKPGPLRKVLESKGDQKARIELWKRDIQNEFKVDVVYQDQKGKDPWAGTFESAAERVGKAYGVKPP